MEVGEGGGAESDDEWGGEGERGAEKNENILIRPRLSKKLTLSLSSLEGEREAPIILPRPPALLTPRNAPLSSYRPRASPEPVLVSFGRP